MRRDNFTSSSTATVRRSKTYPWWQVMCLSGVDYFSTLGYQPGSALLAAGAIAPLATLVLVAVTLCGAVPVYRLVAAQSPNGLGSIALVEKLVSGWRGKFVILVLLGFALTDFMVTITLSSSDAAAHLLQSSSNPWLIPLTIGLVVALAAVFLRGFTEAVTVAVALVTLYLTLTTVVIVVAAGHIIADPSLIDGWLTRLATSHVNPWVTVAVAFIVFPKLALGLSGFETGVAVMPLIKARDRAERIGRARLLVTTSAIVMSLFLIGSAFVCAVLVEPADYAAGGGANGRALAFLAEQYLGVRFALVYSLVTVAILWFAGASAMAGMLALIPRYLPRFGMAPAWAQRSRPMVVLLAAIAVGLVVAFRADVDAQSGAYATGVLVLLFSGAVSVAGLATGRHRVVSGVTAVVLGLTLLANVIERPDGVRVASLFILAIVASSLASRWNRTYELRDAGITFDPAAERIIAAHATGTRVALVPCAPGAAEQALAEISVRPAIAVEVALHDPSAYAAQLHVAGGREHSVPILATDASSVPNAVAVIAVRIQKLTGITPDIYYRWSEDPPLKQALRMIFTGRGQNATATREILRRAIADENLRPHIHVH